MKLAIVIAVAASAARVATPASADWVAGRTSAGPAWGGSHGWQPDDAFPSTPPIQRFGKGKKGMRRFNRSLVRDAEYRRFQQDAMVYRAAASRLEDSRSRCDVLMKDALESGNQAEIEEKREFCRPKAYGPHAR